MIELEQIFAGKLHAIWRAAGFISMVSMWFGARDDAGFWRVKSTRAVCGRFAGRISHARFPLDGRKSY
jgi:galactose mutarotase-like enzyme